jgi:uncharacterized LabA/DUF88 family protein
VPKKYVVMLDGGFVTTKIQQQKKAFPEADDIKSFCNEIAERAPLVGCELLRIYYYDAPPVDAKPVNPISGDKVDLTNSAFAENCRRRIQNLELLPNFAVRLGATHCTGWRLGNKAQRRLSKPAANHEVTDRDFVPNISQKGVDMRIGLDIAQIAIKRLADVLVLVTGDSDMIPAMKLARKEGMLVYLVTMGHGVYRDLKVHADLLLDE